MPLLSIVVPVYNVEKYLDECIRSLRTQTFKDIEIILVDDESPDNCPFMCDRYAELDNRIKVVHKKNEGLGFARNSGLDVAIGEFVTFVDSDDLIDENTYKYLLSKHTCSDCDVIYYKFSKFIGDSSPIPLYVDRHIMISDEEGIDNLKLDVIASDSRLKADRTIKCSACTSIYRRRTIENNKLRFHSERELVSEDLVFNLDFLSVSKKVCIDESELYFYRQNPKSLSHTIDGEKILRFDAFDNYLRENSPRWNLPKGAVLRISRLLLSSYRATLVSILTSSKSLYEKREIFKVAVNSTAFQNAASIYPWRHFALYQKMFFLVTKYRQFYLSWALSNIRNLL